MYPCPGTTLTPEERAALEARLLAAENAYHSLMMGGGVKEFTDQNGEKIVYTAANSAGLLNYINMLRGWLGLCPIAGRPYARPAGVFL